MNPSSPELTIIIPCRSRDSAPLLPPLLEELEKQSFQDFEIYVIQGDRRQGRGINHGVAQSDSPWIMTMDDDTVVDDPTLIEKILAALKSDTTIGMAGAACPIPPDAVWGERIAYRQIKRRAFPIQGKTVDSDFVQHPCLAMPKAVFEQIGGEDEELIRGLDPVLRHKTREAGFRVVIVADTWIYHALPKGLARLFKMYFRNGRGSAFARRHYPDRIFELTEGFEGEAGFTPKRPLLFRIFRRLFGGIGAFLTLKWVRLWTDLAYLTGYVWELIVARQPKEPPEADVRIEREWVEGRVTFWKTIYPET